MTPPRIRLDARYNPHSRTLRGPYWVTGLVNERVTALEPYKIKINAAKPACMGDSIPPGTAQWFDFGLRPKHGDVVLVIAEGQSPICKKWLLVDGEPFLVCHWYTVPLSWIPKVRAIGVCVAEVKHDGWFPHIAHQVMATDEDDVEWRRELNSKPKVHAAIGKMLRDA
jgi:hypothetical protein